MQKGTWTVAWIIQVFGDVQLHFILLLRLSMGVSFKELSKISTKQIWTIYNGVKLVESIKNFTVQSNYKLREWEVNTGIQNSLFMKLFIAL